MNQSYTFIWATLRHFVIGDFNNYHIFMAATDFLLLITDSNTTNGTAPSPPVHPITTYKSHAGAIAGGVIGGIAALALVILLMFCLCRQRQRKSKSQLERSRPVTTAYAKPELEASYQTGYSRPGHLPVGSQHFELETRQMVTESGGAPLHEMDGSARKYVP